MKEKNKTHLSWVLNNNIHLQKLFNVSKEEEEAFASSRSKHIKKERTKKLSERLKVINEQEGRWKYLKKTTPLTQLWFINNYLLEIFDEQKVLKRQLTFLRARSSKKEVPMEEIRAVPIEELIPYGTPKIKRSPSEFTTLCPSHSDTNPSCSINVEKNVWHCFACGEGGTNIGYVMARYNLSSGDAVKKISALIK